MSEHHMFRRLAGSRLFAVVCLAVVAVHFTATAVFLMPLSLVGVHYGHLADRYIKPFFAQRWTLFAPEPPQQDTALHFQCEFADGWQSQWMDLASALQRKHARYRFTPESYLFRLERAAIFAGVGSKDEVMDTLVARAAASEDPNFKAHVERMLELRNRANLQQRRFLYRLIAHHCRETFRADAVRVRPRIVFREIPKYSQRTRAPAETPSTSVVLDWIAVAQIDQRPTPLPRPESSPEVRDDESQ